MGNADFRTLGEENSEMKKIKNENRWLRGTSRDAELLCKKKNRNYYLQIRNYIKV